MLRFAIVLAVLASMTGPQPALACGIDSDCLVDDGRSYRIRMPETETSTGEAIGAIFFAHGYRGSAAGVMRNKSLGAMADQLGVALIALDAAGEDWALAGAPHPGEGQNELTYVDRDCRRNGAVRHRQRPTGGLGLFGGGDAGLDLGLRAR